MQLPAVKKQSQPTKFSVFARVWHQGYVTRRSSGNEWEWISSHPKNMLKSYYCFFRTMVSACSPFVGERIMVFSFEFSRVCAHTLSFLLFLCCSRRNVIEEMLWNFPQREKWVSLIWGWPMKTVIDIFFKKIGRKHWIPMEQGDNHKIACFCVFCCVQFIPIIPSHGTTQVFVTWSD